MSTDSCSGQPRSLPGDGKDFTATELACTFAERILTAYRMSPTIPLFACAVFASHECTTETSVVCA